MKVCKLLLEELSTKEKIDLLKRNKQKKEDLFKRLKQSFYSGKEIITPKDFESESFVEKIPDKEFFDLLGIQPYKEKPQGLSPKKQKELLDKEIEYIPQITPDLSRYEKKKFFDSVQDSLDHVIKDVKKYAKQQIKENQKTIWSVDFSSVCPKKLYGIACPYCYVDDARNIRCNGTKIFGYTKFDKDAFKLSVEQIRELNSIGGIRMFSFGDYIAGPRPRLKPDGTYDLDDLEHGKYGYDDDIVDFLDTCQKHGLLVKVITKQPDFIKKYHNHPNICMINISIDNVATINDDGTYQVYGVNWAYALALSHQFSKVAVRGVALNYEDIIELLPYCDVITLNHATGLEKLRTVLKDEKGKYMYYKEDTVLDVREKVKLVNLDLNEAIKEGVIIKENDKYYFIKDNSIKGKPPLKLEIYDIKYPEGALEVNIKIGGKKKWITVDENDIKIDDEGNEYIELKDKSSQESKKFKIFNKRKYFIIITDEVARANTPIFKRKDSPKYGPNRGELITTKTSDKIVKAPTYHARGAAEKYYQLVNQSIEYNSTNTKSIELLREMAQKVASMCFDELNDEQLLLEYNINFFGTDLRKNIIKFAYEYTKNVGALIESGETIANSDAKQVMVEELEKAIKAISSKVKKKELLEKISNNAQKIIHELASKMCCGGAICKNCDVLCGFSHEYISAFWPNAISEIKNNITSKGKNKKKSYCGYAKPEIILKQMQEYENKRAKEENRQPIVFTLDDAKEYIEKFKDIVGDVLNEEYAQKMYEEIMIKYRGQ